MWKDKRKHLWMLSPSLPIIAMAGMAGYKMAPKTFKALSWTGPIFFHAVIPWLDEKIGEDNENPPEDIIKDLSSDPYYQTILKAFVPLQYAATAMGAWIASKDEVPLEDKIGLMLTVGGINGVGINTGHELGHKTDKISKLFAMAALAPSAYTHFVVEHNFGHHKRVATPEDPASSRFGESFWKFFPRSVIGGLESAIEIEKERLKRRGKSFWTKDNELLQGWAMALGFHGALIALFGKKIIPFLVGQAAYGVSLLEVVNYLEHYGLMREKDENGKYERTKPEHSWNSNRIVSNLFLFQLQRHSDHHANPTRPYQALRHFENSPQLPMGYGSMILPAYIPKVWFEMMNKRVIDHYRGDLESINWDPDEKEKLIAVWQEYADSIRDVE